MTRFPDGRVARAWAGTWDSDWTVVTCIAVLTLCLGLARLRTGPWYQVYSPTQVVALEGRSTGYEVAYYLPLFPSFLGDAPPEYRFSPVHTRTLLNLFTAVTLYGWTGSAFWSLASVDLALWAFAGIAVFFGAQRLGAGRLAAFLAALLTVGSPLFVSGMWQHVQHPAEFASMAIGLWASLALIAQPVGARRRTLEVAGLLLGLSVTYQYQWPVIPLLLVLIFAGPRPRWRVDLAGLLGGVVLFGAASALLHRILDAVARSGGADILAGAVSEPNQLLNALLAGTSSPAAILAALPGRSFWAMLPGAYHPVVFVAGALGLLLVPRRTRALAVVAEVVTLGATLLYSAPWTAMTAYPFLYTGAGMTCVALGQRAARALNGLGVRGRDAAWVARGAALLLALVGIALTNRDLAGDSRFVLEWWDFYARRLLF